MPELPEVETIRLDLRSLVVGRKIVEAWVSPDAPKLVQGRSADDFCRQIAGRIVDDVTRRGKYLLLHLSGGLVWVVHLRMTGSLQRWQAGASGDRFLRARFLLDDGNELCYVDLRKLGMMWLAEDESEVVGKLGPEPLGEGFGPKELRSLLARRSAPVKAVLMDQAAIAGIGNIYADEALFAARVHPARSANSLSRREAERLHWCIRQVLVDAMTNRGSSFRDYVDAAGREGEHQLHVKVFRRTGEPCLDCGTAIERIKVGGRSTHFCPRCQPR